MKIVALSEMEIGQSGILGDLVVMVVDRGEEILLDHRFNANEMGLPYYHGPTDFPIILEDTKYTILQEQRH